MQVVLAHGQAWVYINGELAGTFTADIDTGGDEIGIYVNDDFEGRTWFEDVAVWQWNPVMYRDFPDVDPSYVPPPTPTPLPTATPNPSVPTFGPVSGSILHQPEDGFLELSDAFAQSGDVMIEVTFENPHAPRESHWNYGIYFDSAQQETYHWVYVTSYKTWIHRRRAGAEQDLLQGRQSQTPSINVAEAGENHLRLIVIGDTGWMYVNERFVGNINFSLGKIPNPDRVALIINDGMAFPV